MRMFVCSIIQIKISAGYFPTAHNVSQYDTSWCTENHSACYTCSTDVLEVQYSMAHNTTSLLSIKLHCTMKSLVLFFYRVSYIAKIFTYILYIAYVIMFNITSQYRIAIAIFQNISHHQFKFKHFNCFFLRTTFSIYCLIKPTNQVYTEEPIKSQHILWIEWHKCSAVIIYCLFLCNGI